MTLRDRPGPREAPPELLVLADAEEWVAWLLQRTQRWPKSARFTVTHRVEALAIDIVDELVQARYLRADRAGRLASINLALTRLRYLLRLASGTGACPPSTFESAMRRIDACGRMLHGWRQQLAGATPGPAIGVDA